MGGTAKVSKYKFTGIGLAAKEKHAAEKRFLEYRKNYQITSLSDSILLEELVYREILQVRYKTVLQKFSKSKELKDKVLPPKEILTALDENLERMLGLKQKLGLLNEKRKNEKDPYEYIQKLKEKFKVWRESNQGTRALVCPWCSEMIMLKIRTKAWEAQKHPFFRDRILCSEHLVKLFMSKTITARDVAKVLGVSDDYVAWLVKKWYTNKKD